MPTSCASSTARNTTPRAARTPRETTFADSFVHKYARFENWEESDISESQGIVVSKMNSATAMPPSQGGFSMGTVPAGNASFLAPDENEEKVPF